jgi:hypothetical protein
MKPEAIMKPNQILAEGNDTYYFLRNFLTSKKIENFDSPYFAPFLEIITQISAGGSIP